MFKAFKTFLTSAVLIAAAALCATAATTRYAEIRSSATPSIQPGTTVYGIYLGTGTIRDMNMSTGTVFNHLYVPDGTLAAPGVAFNSQKGLGLYRPTADSITFVANSSRTFFVDTTAADFYTNGVNTWEISSTALFPQFPIDIGRTAFPVKSFIGAGVSVTTVTASTATLTNVSVPGTATVATGVVSSMSVTNLTVTAATFTALSMNSNKITNVSSGTVSKDASTYGQLLSWSNITSSATTTDTTTAGTNFTTTTLGVDIGLKVSSSGRIAIICTGMVRNNTATGQVFAALYRDTTNLDDPTNGQGAQTFATNTFGGQLTVIGYDAPGDMNVHAYRVWMKTNGTGTGHYVDSATGRCIAWETP